MICASGAALRLALGERLRREALSILSPSGPPAQGTRVEHRRMATDLALAAITLDTGQLLAAALVHPVLDGLGSGKWSPEALTWQDL